MDMLKDKKKEKNPRYSRNESKRISDTGSDISNTNSKYPAAINTVKLNNEDIFMS